MRKKFSTSETTIKVSQKRYWLALLGLIIVFKVALKIDASVPRDGAEKFQPIEGSFAAVLQPSGAAKSMREFRALSAAQKKKKTNHRRKKVHTSKTGKHKESTSHKPVTSGVQSNKPEQTDMTRAGEFKGDVRDLPQTPPERIELPKREDPKITRRTAKKTKIKKDN